MYFYVHHFTGVTAVLVLQLTIIDVCVTLEKYGLRVMLDCGSAIVVML